MLSPTLLLSPSQRKGLCGSPVLKCQAVRQPKTLASERERSLPAGGRVAAGVETGAGLRLPGPPAAIELAWVFLRPLSGPPRKRRGDWIFLP